MELTKKELEIIADELRIRIEEYGDLRDILRVGDFDEDYYEKMQAIYQKIITKLL